MRRILLLITDLEIGGTPTVVREIAVRLRSEASIQVACLSQWGPVADELKSAGVLVTALNARNRFDFRIVRSLLELIDAEQIDTVFSFLIHANALSAIAKILRPQLRILQSIQTTQPRPRWHWWLQAVCQRAAEQVIVPSNSVAIAAHDWSHVPTTKIHIIPNAVDPQPLTTAISERVAQVGKPTGARDKNVTGWSTNPCHPDCEGSAGQLQRAAASALFRIGFLGRLDPIKRIDDLIDAVAQLPERFVLAIYGSGAEEPKLRRQVEQHSLANRIAFKGAVQSPWPALAEMDVLVLPSDAEGFGLVLIEAMSVGVPVIATDVPGIRDVVRHARTGLLVQPRDPKGLARAIQQIASDQRLRERLTTAAKQDVQQRFSWETVLPQYRRLLIDQS